MKYGEVLVRYFLQNKDYEDEQRIGEISYDNPMEVYPIIPRKGEQLYLDEIKEDKFQEDYDYFVVKSITYSIGHNKDVMVDIIVEGGYVELYDDDIALYDTDGDDYMYAEYNNYTPKHNRRVFLDEEGYFDC